MGVHRYNHNLEAARSHFPAGRHHAHVGGAPGDARARPRARHGGLLRLHHRDGGDARAARRARRPARRGRARRGPDELPRPAPGHAVRGPAAGAGARDALRAIAAFRLAMPRTVLRFAGGRELTLGDLGARQGMLGGINAIIVGNYLTTLGRDPQEDLDLLGRALDAGQGAQRDAVSARYCDGCGRPADEGDHARCRARRAATDPPRYCTACGAQARRPGAADRLHGALRALRPLMTDVAAALEELRARAARAADVESAPGPRVDARRPRGAAAVLQRLPRPRRATRACAPRPPRPRSAGARAPAPRGSCPGNMALHARARGTSSPRFKGTEACLLFGSGYLANPGVIAALAGRGDVVLSDALNHASIVDGCRLARAETRRLRHADLDALEPHCARAGADVIVTDAVFSMDGDLAPLADIVELARHGARVIVDDAHATGVVGPSGAGSSPSSASSATSTSSIGTLGKALGSYGAFVVLRRDDRATSSSTARARSSTRPRCRRPRSAPRCAALRILRGPSRAVARLHANARVLRERPLGVAASPGHADRPARRRRRRRPRWRCARRALEHGVFAQAIRPPTVPRARRACASSHGAHTPRTSCATRRARSPRPRARWRQLSYRRRRTTPRRRAVLPAASTATATRRRRVGRLAASIPRSARTRLRPSRQRIVTGALAARRRRQPAASASARRGGRRGPGPPPGTARRSAAGRTGAGDRAAAAGCAR